MPISPDELKAMAGGKRPGLGTAPERGLCQKCGYDLAGLRGAARCPECGSPIARSKRQANLGDQMTDAPRGWIAIHQLGTALLTFAAIGAVLFAMIFVVVRRPMATVEASVALAGIALSGLIWAIGAWIVTRPRPATHSQLHSRETEWRRERTLTRWSQPLWCIGLLWLLGVFVLSPKSLITEIFGLSVLAVACAGMFPLFKVLSDMAHWAGDSATAEQLRVSSWIFPLGAALQTFVVYTGIGFMFGGILGTLVVFAVGACFFVLPIAMGIRALWSHWRMARWVLLNNINAELRDHRMRERAEKERQEAATKRLSDGATKGKPRSDKATK